MLEHVLNLFSFSTLDSMGRELDNYLHDQFLDVKAGHLPNLDLATVQTYQKIKKVLKEKGGQ